MLISTVCWGPLNHVELRSGAGLVSPRVWSASQCNCKVTLSRKDIDYLVEFHNCEFQDSVSCQKHDELDSKSVNEHSRTKRNIVSKHLPDRTNRLLIQLSCMLKISILSHRAHSQEPFNKMTISTRNCQQGYARMLPLPLACSNASFS